MAGAVNTMPAATLHAVADQGAFRGNTITGTEQPPQAVLDRLTTLKGSTKLTSSPP